MEQFAFVLTVFFMLLGPVKILPVFADLTREVDERFRRSLAIRAALIASAVVAVVAVIGTELLDEYRISVDGVRLAGGLVLLLAALKTIFSEAHRVPAKPSNATPMQLAVSPLAMPTIVPPSGVAAILIFELLVPVYPRMQLAVGVGLATMMLLDYLVMRFSRAIIKTPGLMLTLQVVGGVMIFMQAAFAVEIMLSALRHLGLIQGSVGS